MDNDLQKRVTLKEQPVLMNKNGKTRQIGIISAGKEIVVDLSKKTDQDLVPIVGPGKFGPTWIDTGIEGWVNLTMSNPVAKNQFRYLLITRTDGSIISCTRIG